MVERMSRYFVHRGRTGIAVVATAIVGAMAAGCGNQASSADTPAKLSSKPRCGAGTGKPASGQPIPVGALMTASGGSDISGGAVGARAYFDCLNANGGINGRPVQYTAIDDGLDPAKAVRGATELVADKQVVAIVGGSSYLECAVAGPIYAKAGLLEIEANGAAQQCFTSPNITSVAMGAVTTNVGNVQYAVRKLGAKRIAVLTPNIPGLGQAVIDGIERYAKSAGVTVVSTLLYQPGVRDATSLLLATAAKNPDFIEVSAVPQDATTIFNAAQAQDMKSRFKWGCPSPCHAPQLASALPSYWDGAITISMPLAAFDASTRDNELWRSVMGIYASGKPEDQFSQGGFLAAKIFADTIAEIHGEIDRASVSRALKSIRNYHSDLMCGPFYWPKGSVHIVNHATRIASIEHGQFRQTQGCTEVADPALAPIIAAESNG